MGGERLLRDPDPDPAHNQQPESYECGCRTHSGSPRPEALTSGEGGEHAQGGAGDAQHARQAVADVHADGDHDTWHDGGLVTQGQAKDDVGGGAGAAGVRHVLWVGSGEGAVSVR